MVGSGVGSGKGDGEVCASVYTPTVPTPRGSDDPFPQGRRLLRTGADYDDLHSRPRHWTSVTPSSSSQSVNPPAHSIRNPVGVPPRLQSLPGLSSAEDPETSPGCLQERPTYYPSDGKWTGPTNRERSRPLYSEDGKWGRRDGGEWFFGWKPFV